MATTQGLGYSGSKQPQPAAQNELPFVPLECAIQESPSGDWLVVIDGRALPLLFTTRPAAAAAVRWLQDTYTSPEQHDALHAQHVTSLAAP